MNLFELREHELTFDFYLCLELDGKLSHPTLYREETVQFRMTIMN